MDFKESIKPFFWVEYQKGASLCLSSLNYKAEIFDSRADEGFLGNGYDWESLARVFLEEKMPELDGIVNFDPEADMFCAYSSDTEALKGFALAFKEACENRELITDMFSRAELD